MQLRCLCLQAVGWVHLCAVVWRLCCAGACLEQGGAQPPSVRAGSSPVCFSAGAAFGAVGVLLVLDVLLDDVQGCAAGGDDRIRR